MRHETEQAAGWGLHLTPLERHNRTVVALCVAAVGLLLAMHYTAALHQLGVHDALRRLFYLPVILAAIAAGSRGGLGVAVVAVIGFLPHLRQLARLDTRVMDSVVELVLLLAVGGLVGGFADASRRARAQAAERGRLAALGEMGLALMAQTEGPLAAIEGQAESLITPTGAGGRGSVTFAAQVIREEAARARQLLADLGEIGRISEPRRDRVELAPMLERVVRDVGNARQDGRRALLIEHPHSCTAAADRRALAFSLRTLIFGLLDSVPPPGWVEVRISGLSEAEPTVELGVFSLGDPLPDLEESLTKVFGAGPAAYRFREVLCLRLLTTQGASVRFDRASPCHMRIIVGLPAFVTNHHAEVRTHGHAQQQSHHSVPPLVLKGRVR